MTTTYMANVTRSPISQAPRPGSSARSARARANPRTPRAPARARPRRKGSPRCASSCEGAGGDGGRRGGAGNAVRDVAGEGGARAGASGGRAMSGAGKRNRPWNELPWGRPPGGDGTTRGRGGPSMSWSFADGGDPRSWGRLSVRVWRTRGRERKGSPVPDGKREFRSEREQSPDSPAQRGDRYQRISTGRKNAVAEGPKAGPGATQRKVCLGVRPSRTAARATPRVGSCF